MKKIRDSLVENSISYHNKSNIYEDFTKAEDYPNKIRDFLISKLKRKIIVDFGCGNGKYAKLLSNQAKKYIGIDISREQVRRAKKKFRLNKKIEIIHSSIEKVDLPSDYADIIISSWAISTINGYDRKNKSLREALRILKIGGTIFLIENDIGGEFEIIRGRYPDVKRTKEYNNWVLKKGFKVEKRIKTYFRFRSVNSARRTIGSIWGERTGELVKNKVIKHNIVIFSKNK